MLLQFKVKNYKSFADEAVLDMTATAIKEHKNTLIEKNGVKVLPVAAIFGANAGGKSNLFDAFNNMRGLISRQNYNDDIYLGIPFLFDKEFKDMPTEFEVCINIGNLEYRYGFSLNLNIVKEEWLFQKSFNKNSNSKERLIYYRDCSKADIQLGSVAKAEMYEINFVSSMASVAELLLPMIARRNKSKYKEVSDWFTNNAITYITNTQEYLLSEIIAKYLYNTEILLNEVLNLIRTFDSSIVDIRIEKDASDNIIEKYFVYSLHLNEKNEEVQFPFALESEGTKKLFAFSVTLISALENGETVWIDELDAKLHPLILRYIIKMFKNKEKNSNGAQLIFSSHNLVCLDASDLRRDEIWFVEKNNQKSALYSLYDFKTEDAKIRSDLSFGKHYLAGRFGAIPFQSEVE